MNKSLSVQSPINLSMHIRSYLNEFNQLKSSSIKQVETILTSPNKARKSFKKLHQLDQQQFTDNFIQIKKSNDKINELTFDDELFTALYKTNQRLSHQRYNALAAKVNPAKLQFKINYLENQKPIVKQKILFKANKQAASTIVNLNTEERIDLADKTQKRKIQKSIASNNDQSLILEIKTSSRHKNNLIKEKIVNFDQNKNQTKKSSQIKKCNTLLTHKIKFSLNNNDFVGYFKQKSSNLMHLTPYNTREKLSMWNELPEYAKNIMKPCKIQGMQLTNRPQKIIKGRRSLGGVNKRGEYVKSEQKIQEKQQQNVRLIKTARQRRKPRRTDSNRSYNPERIIQVQPWNHRQQSFEEQDQLLFSTEEINSLQWSGVKTDQ